MFEGFVKRKPTRHIVSVQTAISQFNVVFWSTSHYLRALERVRFASPNERYLHHSTFERACTCVRVFVKFVVRMFVPFVIVCSCMCSCVQGRVSGPAFVGGFRIFEVICLVVVERMFVLCVHGCRELRPTSSCLHAEGIVEEVLNMWGSFSFRTGTALGQLCDGLAGVSISHVNACTLAHDQAHAYVHAHAPSHSHDYAQAHAHVRAHTCTHTHAHTHAHTHTRPVTDSQSQTHSHTQTTRYADIRMFRQSHIHTTIQHNARTSTSVTVCVVCSRV